MLFCLSLLFYCLFLFIFAVFLLIPVYFCVYLIICSLFDCLCRWSKVFDLMFLHLGCFDLFVVLCLGIYALIILCKAVPFFGFSFHVFPKAKKKKIDGLYGVVDFYFNPHK